MEVHDNLLLSRNGKENPKEESSHWYTQFWKIKS